MRAWRIERLEGPGALVPVEAPEPPPPGPGEALVALRAVALNLPDVLMSWGRYQFRPPLPFTPGIEAVGIIAAVGEGVAADLIGRRMLVGARSGLLAQRITSPLSALREAPEVLSDEEAAAFTVGALTAHVGLVERGRLAAGERVLVAGAGGGMGLAAVQRARLDGARVTALASTQEKRHAALAAGAHEAVAGPRGVAALPELEGRFDLVFDPVGGALTPALVAALARRGRYAIIGFAAGAPGAVPWSIVAGRELELLGVRAGEAGRQDPAAGARHLAAIDARAAALAPLVGQTWPFDETPRALAALSGGSTVGKLVVRMPEP